MYITLEEDKPMDKEEVKPTGDGASRLKIKQGFTRGPLSVGRAKRKRSPTHVWIKTRSGEIVADVRALPPLTVNTERASETTEANARLFAAAPALYEALKELLNYGVEFDDARLSHVSAQIDRQAIADARAALALVDGPTSEEANV